MAARVRTTPLVVVLSMAIGASAAAVIGMWVVPWGVAVGVAGALVVLSVGLWREPRHRELFLVLATLAALDLGVLAATIPSTLLGLDAFVASRLPELRALAADTVHRALPALVYRWITMGAALPLALTVLIRDARRAR